MKMLTNSYYVNLDHRDDRRTNITHELEKLNVTSPTRIPGIVHKQGIIGCLLSHVAALELGLGHEDEEYIAVFEDDAVFLHPKIP
jgi:hypothetical protein